MRRLVLFGILAVSCATPAPLSISAPLPVMAKKEEPPAPPPAVLLPYVAKSNPGLDAKEAERVARLIQQVAEEYEIEVPLFAAIIRQESHFRTGQKACRSYNGIRRCDYGLAQVNSFWIDELELDAMKLRTDDLYNLRVGAQILKDVLDRHNGEYGYYNTADPDLRLSYVTRIERHKKQILATLN